MFPLPLLPTDSLYKFLFVGGIFLMLFSVYFQFRDSGSVVNQTLKLDSVSNRYLLQSDLLKNQENFNGKSHDSDTLQKLFLGLRKVFRDFQHEENRFKLIKNENAYRFVYLDIMFSGGLTIAIVGGFCWWKFIQKLQNRLIEIQVALAERELIKIGGGRKHVDPIFIAKSKKNK